MSPDPWYEYTVLEFEYRGVEYEFVLVGLTRRPSDGKLFWSTDSGCSCTAPWAEHTEADWQPLPETWMEFVHVTQDKAELDPTTFLEAARRLVFDIQKTPQEPPASK